MLFHLGYESSATYPMNATDLEALLMVSRANNVRDKLSGMLLYKEGNFLQVLEGEKDQVLSLTAKLRRDPRHTNMLVLFSGAIEARTFEGWSMGFNHLTDMTVAEVPGYSEFMDLSLTSDAFASDPAAIWRLLMLFKTTSY